MQGALYAGSHRFVTRAPGRATRHSFSFGEHYDPANLGFGPLVCHNDDLLSPAGGYPDHPHADLEIVTWVLDGVLLHTDSRGNTTPLQPGDVQVMSAGSGIRHAEIADRASGPTRFIQAWVRPDEPGLPPTWRHEHVEPDSGLTEVVGADGLSIGTAGARFLVARLAAGDRAVLPREGRTHVFLARGSGRLDQIHLASGDAVRLAAAGESTFTADSDAELLVWSFA